VQWDGSAPLEIGLVDQSTPPTAMLWFDDGTGERLHIFGAFVEVSGAHIEYAAAWDGHAWSALANGPHAVLARPVVYDDGSGAAIYGIPAHTDRLYRWDGDAWTVFASAGLPDSFELLGVADFGRGSELIARHLDWDAYRTTLWSWDGAEWRPLPHQIDGTVSQLVTMPSPSGALTYAAGSFVAFDGEPASGIAVWDGASWRGLDSAQTGKGVSGGRLVVSVGPEGGPDLGDKVYVAGRRYEGGMLQGHQRLGTVASWDGRSWRSLGPRIGGEYGQLNTMVLADIGEGPRLLLGGQFSPEHAGFASVGQFDGNAWRSVGPAHDLWGEVRALAVFDAGRGPELYAAGEIWTESEGKVNLARFDGARWRAVGAAFDGPCNALLVFDDGAGPALYAGGAFTRVGSRDIGGIARWDGVEWAQVGGGLSSADGPPALADLIPLDMHGRRLLIARGVFDVDGSCSGLGAWDGSGWGPACRLFPHPFEYIESAPGSSGPRAIVAFRDELVSVQEGDGWRLLSDDHDGYVFGATIGATDGTESVYLVGAFSELGGQAADGFARFGCPRCVADFDVDDDVDGADASLFLTLWADGDLGADVDPDGIVDSRDIVEFLNLWTAGC